MTCQYREIEAMEYAEILKELKEMGHVDIVPLFARHPDIFRELVNDFKILAKTREDKQLADRFMFVINILENERIKEFGSV